MVEKKEKDFVPTVIYSFLIGQNKVRSVLIGGQLPLSCRSFFRCTIYIAVLGIVSEIDGGRFVEKIGRKKRYRSFGRLLGRVTISIFDLDV